MKRIVSYLALICSDLVMLVVAFLLSFWTRVWVLPTFGVSPKGFFNATHFVSLSYILLVFLLVFFYERLYSDPLDPYEEFLHLVRGLFLAIILIAVFVYFSGLIEVFARTILFMIPLFGALLLPFGRFLTRWLLRRCGLFRRQSALVGNGRVIAAFLHNHAALQRLGFRLVGWLGEEDGSVALPHLGGLDTLELVVEEKRLDSLFILSEGLHDEVLKRVINRSEHRVAELRIVPRVGPMHGLTTEIEYLDDQLLLKNRNNLYSGWNRLVKRSFDLILSFVLILVFGLPLLLVALAIRIDSRGGVFFKQDRFGRLGRTFRLWKFRTMYKDADVRLERFLQEQPQFSQEWLEYKKIKSVPDPRVTPVGRWLRRFSIDEWPQIVQVLIGEMSLVGPRPYLIREQEEIQDSAAIIFRVKSGLTGLWQIRGRNELPFRERIRLDEYYVRNWSLSLDGLILLKTFMVVLKGKGAY